MFKLQSFLRCFFCQLKYFYQINININEIWFIEHSLNVIALSEYKKPTSYFPFIVHKFILMKCEYNHTVNNEITREWDRKTNVIIMQNSIE